MSVIKTICPECRITTTAWASGRLMSTEEWNVERACEKHKGKFRGILNAARSNPAGPWRMEMSYRDPTEAELKDPLWNRIWQEIKTWDINVPAEYGGYCGATGNHVCAIFDAVYAQPSASEGERVEQRLGNAKVVALESENSKRRFATIAGRTFELDASRFHEGATVEFSARLVPTKVDEHDYLSTACFHGKHKLCRKECKFCRSSCQCSCHATKGGADHE